MPTISPQLSVAIVDDERSVRTSMERLLRASGIHAEGFASGAAFVERLGTGGWQVVLLDIHMPGLTGFELLTRIRDERPDVAVIMITGYEDPEVKKRAFEAGARGFLLKPFMFAEFAEAIKALRNNGSEAIA